VTLEEAKLLKEDDLLIYGTHVVRYSHEEYGMAMIVWHVDGSVYGYADFDKLTPVSSLLKELF
jgi:hypothetical protein